MRANEVNQPTAADESQVTTRTVASQLLFAAGNSLTTKGFFNYFVDEFHPGARMLALLQVAPETAETLGMAARWLTFRLGSRKRLWMGCVTVGRLAALAIPLALFSRGRTGDQLILWYILLCTLAWYGAQGVAYVTYLSWLSNLVPYRHWGRFFARWSIASLAVAIVVPVAVGFVRDQYLRVLPREWQTWSYGVIFAAGSVVVLLSMLPMLVLPDVPPPPQASLPSSPGRSRIWSSLLSPDYRCFAMHYWWLSFFQGLTQSAMFLYQTRILGIQTTTFYCMNGLMLALQIPLAILGGKLSDAGRERQTVITGLLLVSSAMGFWLAATPETWWLLWGAYAVWGLFGAVNVCEQNLNLKLAPPGDNALHLSVVRQWGGAFAAAAGLIGGWWLDAMAGEKITAQTPVAHFHAIFFVSWIGRATAPLWLLLSPSKSSQHPG